MAEPDAKELKETKDETKVETKAESKGGFNWSSDPSIFIIIGRPATGKSFMVRSILYSYFLKKHFLYGLCYTGTIYNREYEDYIPKENIRGWEDQSHLQNYIEGLRAAREKNGGNPLPPNFIILDDLFGKIDFYDEWMSNWISTFRHTSTTVIMVSQYIAAKSTSTSLRNMCSYAILFKTTFANSLKSFYEAFGSNFENYKTFKEVFKDATTGDFNALMWKLSSTDDLRDMFKRIKAEKTPAFKFDFSKKGDVPGGGEGGRPEPERKAFMSGQPAAPGAQPGPHLDVRRIVREPTREERLQNLFRYRNGGGGIPLM